MITSQNNFHAHGKLLLTAEYFVLDGALALALPVKLGQSLDFGFRPDSYRDSDFGNAGELHWQSFDEKNECWFEVKFSLENFEILQTDDPAVADRLQKILRKARNLNPGFQQSTINNQQSTINSHLDFPRLWGLGTSSTLVYLVAQWAEVDAFELQFRTFGGSGYDIACAGADGPILYSLKNGKPHVEACDFHPTFANCLYFIYLGQKQDSREGIKNYRLRIADCGLGAQEAVSKISDLTRQFLASQTLAEFDDLFRQHEALVAETTGLPRAKSLFFSDFWGEIKSLGAWGGDFVLATSDRPEEETRQYFNEKGYEVFLPYEALIL
ncbi:MAG: GHMP kinase [Bacteroidetes bacterium]|nr:GHMP kinase [Bacteroidota bacterium]